MNVLPLVFSFLALITILTYTRLSGFVVTQAVHREYEHFLKDHQEGVQSMAAFAKYEEVSSPADKKGPGSPKVKAQKCLNLSNLFNQDEKGKETAYIFKNLIDTLFSEAPFYKEACFENPLIVDELIVAMQTAFSELKDKKSFKKGDLCTLELSNERLQYFFYKLLKDPEKTFDEEGSISEEATRILNEVITFKSEKQPIRLFLANPVLLKAIFQKDDVVKEIVAARKNYYNLVKKNPDRKEALSDEFRSRFSSALPPAIQLTSVNWEVSGTMPESLAKKL